MSSPSPIAGGGGVVGSFQQAYNTAWYASRAPQMQPLYWGRPGVVIPAGASPLTESQFEALIEHLVANIPVNPATGKQCSIVEGIDYYGGDPYTYNFIASQDYGDTWFPAGHGGVSSSEVIKMGQFGGTPPAGTPYTAITLVIADLIPWPVTEPVTPIIVSDLVGPLEFSNIYGIPDGVTLPSEAQPLGSTTSNLRGTFKLIESANMFGITYYWQLQPATA